MLFSLRQIAQLQARARFRSCLVPLPLSASCPRVLAPWKLSSHVLFAQRVVLVSPCSSPRLVLSFEVVAAIRHKYLFWEPCSAMRQSQKGEPWMRHPILTQARHCCL